MNIQSCLACFLGLLCLITADYSKAAANGGKGYGQAEADFGISINLGPKVRIWGLENFDMSEAAAGRLTKPICIYSNSDVGFNAHIVTENTFKLANGDNIGASYQLTLYMKPDKNTKAVSGIWGDIDGSNIPFYEIASVGLSPEMSCDAATSNVDLTIALGKITDQNGFYSDQVTITISPL